MSGRIIEIGERSRHLSIRRGFLVVADRDDSGNGEAESRVPLDDLDAVIVHGIGASYSGAVAATLAEHNIALIFCGAGYRPQAMIWPVEGNWRQSARMRAQIGASRPLCKQLWRDVVRAKIAAQASVMDHLGDGGKALRELCRKVRSGDPDNIEAQAAQKYWKSVMGGGFRRRSRGDWPNPMFNYGYGILRSTLARAVAAAGLHPTLGIHHHGRSNPMCLVDDLMEPFRPFADIAVVRRLREDGRGADVSREDKKALAAVLNMPVSTRDGGHRLGVCATRAAQSLAASFERGRNLLDLPMESAPLELEWDGASIPA